MNGLTTKVTTTVIWSAVEKFSVQGAQFVLTIFIARLVSPSDYGLIAMLQIFISIADTIIDSGFSNALIHKKDRCDIDFSTVFYFNILVGISIYFLLYIFANMIASFYGEPQLETLTKVVALNVFFTSLTVIQRAKLAIALNFRLLAFISFISIIISGIIGIVLAYKGYGVWSLVVLTLLNNILITILLYICVRWFPKLVFSWKSFKELFNFGSKLLLSGLLYTLYINMYNLIIGKKYSSVNLGFYNRAYSLAFFPSNNLSGIIVRAVYPIQCNMQDDAEKLSNFFLKSLRMSVYIIFPLMTLLFVLSKPVILVLLTEKWLPIVELLQLMCLAFVWEPIMKMNNNILMVKGHADYLLKAEVLKKIVAIIILLITLPLGLKNICMGLILYSVFDVLIVTFYVKKAINITLIQQMKSILILFFLSFIMGVCIYFLIQLVDLSWLQLLIGIIIGITIYITLSFCFRIDETKIIILLWKNITKIFV